MLLLGFVLPTISSLGRTDFSASLWWTILSWPWHFHSPPKIIKSIPGIKVPIATPDVALDPSNNDTISISVDVAVTPIP